MSEQKRSLATQTEILFELQSGVLTAKSDDYELSATLPLPGEVPVATISRLFVDPQVRGTGIATEMMNVLKGEAKKSGATQIETMIKVFDPADEEETKAFFEKFGFLETEPDVYTLKLAE